MLRGKPELPNGHLKSFVASKKLPKSSSAGITNRCHYWRKTEIILTLTLKTELAGERDINALMACLLADGIRMV